MSKQYFVMAHDEARARAIHAVKTAPAGFVVEVKEPTRSMAQNALLWSLLGQIAKNVEWYGKYLTSENWKDIFSASLKNQLVVPGLDGGFVVCGQSTSKMTKAQLSDLCELILAFGSERGVTFWECEVEA